jgi:selenocysteine lyase/cysteine desulfurase
MSFDASWARSQFPALSEQVNNQPAVFFDGPGGTQVPERVITAISDYLRHSNANTHGAFLTSNRTDAIIEDSRQAMADLAFNNLHGFLSSKKVITPVPECA